MKAKKGKENMLSPVLPGYGRRTVRSLGAVLILFVVILGGCRKDSVTDTVPESEKQAPAGQQVAEATPDVAPIAADAAAEDTKGAPVPLRDEDGNAVSIDSKGRITKLPITVSPAKPMLTPGPDPFPARPTPTVVVKDGKIVQQWEAPSESLALVNPVKGSAEATAEGKKFYMQRCVDCHGKEGKGNGWLSKGVFKPPTNLASRMVQANSDGELYWKITNGRSPMPASRIRFTDEQRWQIVNYVRTFKP
ncbi:MAG: cytochrome c [Acidobacteria bacterium]|nr:cytochrome c [Acidobacteriota bacterium]